MSGAAGTEETPTGPRAEGTEPAPGTPSRSRHLKRIVFGTGEGIAGTVYGTIVVMGAIIAGASGGHPEPWRLAITVAVTVLVFWAAHVYSDALGESIHRGHRLDRKELEAIGRRELAIPLAAVAPFAALLLGGFDVMREATAIWLALGIGVATLAFEGVRYARIEQLGRRYTLAVVGSNVTLGLVLVALKALISH